MNPKSLLPPFIAVDCGAFRPIVWMSLFLTLAFAQTGYPVPINILNAQYTTSLSLGENGIPPSPGTNYSRTQVSPGPISDSLYNPVKGYLSAQANAGLLRTSAFTDAGGSRSVPSSEMDQLANYSEAIATSELWFSPLTSQTTTITIQFSGWNQWFFSAGTVSLLDITTGNEMWNYGWNFSGTVPWVPSGESYPNPIETATLQLDTAFNVSDTYYLYMNAGTGSNPPDVEQILIQLSGLEPVPEPSTFALLGLGSLVLAMVRRRR